MQDIGWIGKKYWNLQRSSMLLSIHSIKTTTVWKGCWMKSLRGKNASCSKSAGILRAFWCRLSAKPVNSKFDQRFHFRKTDLGLSERSFDNVARKGFRNFRKTIRIHFYAVVGLPDPFSVEQNSGALWRSDAVFLNKFSIMESGA